MKKSVLISLSFMFVISSCAIVTDEYQSNKKKLISGSYVEFAERLPLKEYQHLPASELNNHHRREGFEVNNADKIFESTYSSQTNKSKN